MGPRLRKRRLGMVVFNIFFVLIAVDVFLSHEPWWKRTVLSLICWVCVFLGAVWRWPHRNGPW